MIWVNSEHWAVCMARLKNGSFYGEKEHNAVCIMIFELHNEMDANKQSLRCSLHVVFGFAMASNDHHMQRMIVTEEEEEAHIEIEMCPKKKWVDLKFGLHHFRFMQILFNFQYACCSFNGLMLLLLLLLFGWWKETIVQSGILLVSAFGKLLPPTREWDRAELKNCTQKFMSCLVNTWKKIAYFAAVSSPYIHHPSRNRSSVRDDDFEFSHFSVFHAEHHLGKVCIFAFSPWIRTHQADIVQKLQF